MTLVKSIKKLVVLACFGFLCTQIIAQVNLTPDRFAFEPELTYNSAIPSPAKVLGYELGERFTEYAATVDYMEKLAAASDRITNLRSRSGGNSEKSPCGRFLQL